MPNKLSSYGSFMLNLDQLMSIEEGREQCLPLRVPEFVVCHCIGREE